MSSPFFTIFTPTYNRAHLLPRVYASICKQNFQDFEWVIVDDGSTDNTASLIDSWREEAGFSIVYQRQENAGRYIAINKGINLAKGKFFLILDSDDWLADHSLQITNRAWESIPDEEKNDFSGIWGMCAYENGDVIGDKFPENIFDLNTIEISTIHHVTGDKCHAIRTDIRREFMFPEGAEKYCMPSLVWNRIALKYKTRFINDILQFKEYQEIGLSHLGKKKLILYPNGYRLQSREYTEIKTRFIPEDARKAAMAQYIRASLHAKVGLIKQFLEIVDKPLWFKSLPRGAAQYFRDLYKYK